MADGRDGRKATVDPKLLELLACPLTKGPLTWDAERSELISRVAKLAYPVRDGIPIMLPAEARTIAAEDALKPPPRLGGPS
ncbi:Trm112 family protein [Mesorhizobium sp. M1A.F.Ca.IN.022.04.1.1]|uniref:Trm112 family protein n=1 Tax=Mesorhizobium sp. M1A.F.Ca.IN.022.04.1.1 TaxID=2496773 RepID=UPI000FCAA69A|nr:Trm112 family protein [Mesorhizobium sp. M1A.F.Ca.IN.022.04.1.1]RUV26439.1 Trm112 family protein [Mesorhizobium sp. M1A.F.Ca.IN.022.04.1.1]